MEKIIKKFGLKAGANTVFTKAHRDLRVTDQEILDILPLKLWFDKKKIDECSRLIRQQLETRGIIIGDFEIPERKAGDFSLENYFPFNLLPANQAASIQKSTGPPHRSDCEAIIPLSDTIILVAFGGICVEKVNEDGRINRIKYFSAGEFFRSTDDFQATVATSYAFFWKFSKKNIKTFPPLISEFLEFISDKEFDTLRWISAKTELNSTKRLELSCEYVDEKYPREHIVHTTDEDRASITHYTRETVTRRKNIHPSIDNEGQ